MSHCLYRIENFVSQLPKLHHWDALLKLEIMVFVRNDSVLSFIVIFICHSPHLIRSC
jgi:hypothetical protein